MSLFSNLSTLFGAQSRREPNAPKKTRRFARPPKRQPQPAPQRQPRQPLPPQQLSPKQMPANFQDQLDKLEREAQAKAREIVVEAKAEALTIRSKAENESREISRQLEQQQRSLEDKLDKLDHKLSTLDQKEGQLEKDRSENDQVRDQLEKKRQQVLQELEKVSSLTLEEAKLALFDRLEKKLSKEMALFIRQKEEEAKAEAEENVKEILIDSMKHGATDYVPEYTVSVVSLPSEETKGKIIGKAGRNINAFEQRTGVDVDLDMSPTEVRLSSFDPVRREVARISLERLIKDGRIQPSRIEEVVAKVESELDKVMLEAGKNLCHEVGVYNLPVDLMRMLGKFKYRFSYGQNLISHTLEETKIGMKLASELKVDVNTVKLGCLLHDIGKVAEEAEGSHVELGVKIAKRFNLPQAVIDCIAQHHEDEPFSGPEQMVVYIADAISGARPGARYENYEEYVKRLQTLEEIATDYDQVRQAYAIQAGREVRVLLDPETSKDDDVTVLSLKIRDQIKEKVTYPGTVTVTVIRETRGQSVAN
jgi:ribonucrease Y